MFIRISFSYSIGNDEERETIKEEFTSVKDAIEFLKSCEEDYEKEVRKAESRAENAWDAHKEECPEVDHEKCF